MDAPSPTLGTLVRHLLEQLDGDLEAIAASAVRRRPDRCLGVARHLCSGRAAGGEAHLLWRAFGSWVAFAVSAAVFGFSHLGNPNATVFAATCIALEAGVMLGAFYALTGGVWVSIGVHMAWNFTQGYVFGIAVSGTELGPAIARSMPNVTIPEWLTGGAFGPEASLPGLVVCLAVGLGVVWLAWRRGQSSKQ